MSKRVLRVAEDLSLPLELAARTQCIFAQKGAGKTYAAGVMAEEMLGHRVQIVVLDPTGAWWGLQSSADGGKSPYEIIVMGGEHADVPLEADAGEIVAQFIVESGQSVVLDVSQLETQVAQDRFALALATKLYRLKAHDKANLHIFLDEADQFCPLRPQKGQEKLLHAWDTIVRLGRSRGLGLTAISQRPAVVHTNIRNNVDLLTCLRVTGINDFKALREWTNIYATKEQAAEFLESVPRLPDGEAFFWSPSWLKIFQRAKVRKKHTFDSSRTPKPGERAIAPKARRAPDLTKLTEQINASVQRAKENDPKELRKSLAQLKAENQKLAAQLKNVPVAKEITKPGKRIEVPVITDHQLKRLETLYDRAGKRAAAFSEKLGPLINPLMKELHEEQTQIGKLLVAARAVNEARSPTNSPTDLRAAVRTVAPHRAIAMKMETTRGTAVSAQSPVVNSHSRRIVAEGEEPIEGITKRQQKFLDVAATLTTLGTDVTRETVAGWLGIHPRGGSVGEELAAIEKLGFIINDKGRITVTEAGMAAATQLDPAAAIESAKSGLSNRQRKFFEMIINAYPESMTREAIAAACDPPIHPRGGSLGEDLGRLVGRGLVEGTRGSYRARDFLFAGTEAANA